MKKKFFADILWDLFCISSLIGIWPRFIEPNYLKIKKLQLSTPKLPNELEGLKILHLSDLHVHPGLCNFYLEKLKSSITKLKPDLICITGDFLCYSEFKDKKRLYELLNVCSAPYGCYGVFGNHDYAESVGINSDGDYDVADKKSSLIGKGFKRLFSKIVLSKKITAAVEKIPINQELVNFLAQTPCQILDNQTKLIKIKDSFLNITGLGEYSLGRCRPDIAFHDYNSNYPGIILLHNPDGSSTLKKFPGDIILSGHTHGGQINLPFIWRKLTLLENMDLKSGLKRLNEKWLYISRGLGSTMSFRWFAPPELVLITLEKKS